MPGLLFNLTGTGSFYGIPATAHEEQGTWKFDRHGGPALRPDELVDKDPAKGAGEVAECAAYINKYVRWLGSQPTSIEPCIYTMTKDEDFIIDRIPTRPNIVVGAGFSGHGFKLAPVVGRILVQLALGGPEAVDTATRSNLHHWSITRPAVTEPARATDFPYVTAVAAA